MYTITAEAKALYDAEARRVLRITGTDKNGTAISITDADVMLGGFQIDRYSCNGDKIEVGTAIASEMTLTLDNYDGRFDNIVFEGTELYVEIGIADWAADEPHIYWMPCGYYTPDKQPRTLSVITIKALDRMTRFDEVAESLTIPATVSGLVGQICTACGITREPVPTSLPNRFFSLTAIPALQQKPTYRDVLRWCAGIMGACAYINYRGNLQLSWYSSVDYETTVANRYSSDLHENDITITGVTYTNTSGATIISGTPEYTLDLTGNYLVSQGVSTILPALNTALNGFAYRPFEASVIGAPYLWPMDMITFTDKNGTSHSCVVTNVNFGLNGQTAISGKGETAQLNSGVAPSAMTEAQAFLLESAIEYVRNDIDESLTQEDIFNRLTNNGVEQGLYLYNGKVYLNASYIQSGTIAADYIKGGTLTLGGYNNTDGVLEIRNASNKKIGYWDNTGIHISSGTIELRKNTNQGLNIDGNGNIAIGIAPNDITSFDGNKTEFQINDKGDIKVDTVSFYDAGADDDGIRTFQGSIVARPDYESTYDADPGIAMFDKSGFRKLQIMQSGVKLWGELDIAGTVANVSNYYTVQHIGTTFDGGNVTITDGNLSVTNGNVTVASGGINITGGDVTFSNSGTTRRQVKFIVGDNDYGRISAGATAANAGWVEIASGDDGNEPIYARQYSGDTTVARQLTLLDSSGNTTFPGSIYYKGSQATNRMIHFLDNTDDAYGNGISIGGGGATIIGGGKSASTAEGLLSNAGSEVLYLCNDGNVDVYTGLQSGTSSAKHSMFGSNGTLYVYDGHVVVGNGTNDTSERQLQVDAGAGQIYMYSQGSTTGYRGIWLPAHGTGAAKGALVVDTNNNVTLNGNATTATALTSNAGDANTPVYFSGGKPVATSKKLGAENANGHWGMKTAENGDDWIRTTTLGIIPYQPGNAGSGHSGLGTSRWYFSYAYIDNIYGTLNGHATSDLALTGGTLTGELNRKATTVDASKTNNNISSTVYPTTFNVTDASDRILARMEALIYANGNIASYWYVRNYNTSGTQVAQKGIMMTMAKDGTLTYSVSDNAKFRTALGLTGLATASIKYVDTNLTSSSTGVITVPSDYAAASILTTVHSRSTNPFYRLIRIGQTTWDVTDRSGNAVKSTSIPVRITYLKV